MWAGLIIGLVIGFIGGTALRLKLSNRSNSNTLRPSGG
jgi:hypothetical protein